MINHSNTMFQMFSKHSDPQIKSSDRLKCINQSYLHTIRNNHIKMCARKSVHGWNNRFAKQQILRCVSRNQFACEKNTLRYCSVRVCVHKFVRITQNVFFMSTQIISNVVATCLILYRLYRFAAASTSRSLRSNYAVHRLPRPVHKASVGRARLLNIEHTSTIDRDSQILFR